LLTNCRLNVELQDDILSFDDNYLLGLKTPFFEEKNPTQWLLLGCFGVKPDFLITDSMDLGVLSY